LFRELGEKGEVPDLLVNAVVINNEALVHKRGGKEGVGGTNEGDDGG